MTGGKAGRLIGALTLTVALAGCGGASREAPLESFSAQQIYNLGEAELENGKPKDAARYFGEVERLYLEIMGKPGGVCAGRGGSQHLCFDNFYSNGVQGGIDDDADITREDLRKRADGEE